MNEEDRTNRKNYYLQILNLIKKYELAAGYYTAEYMAGQQDVTNTELQILIQLDCDPLCNAAGIAAALRLEKSTIARAIQSLEQKGYLTRSTGAKDKRQKVLRLKPAARPILVFQLVFHQKVYARFSKQLSSGELKQIATYMKRFADVENIPALSVRPGESIHTVEMRRLGRAHSTIGNSFMYSGYSTAEWQLLTELDSGKPLTPGMLSNRLFMPKNTLSQILSKARKKQLVSEKQDRSDKRTKWISITGGGVKALSHIRDTAVSHYEEVFQSFSTRELEDFCDLFSRYVGYHEFDAGEAEVLLTDGLSVRVLEDEKVRSEARGFHILNAVRLQFCHHLPEELFHRNNKNFGLYVSDSLEGVAEISCSEDEWVLQSASVATALEQERPAELFLGVLKEKARRAGAILVVKEQPAQVFPFNFN